MMRAAAALAAVLALAACADGCDPNQAGFFGGVRNIATGCYERDTAALRTGAAQSEQQAQALDADNAHIQMELGRLDTQEKQLRERQQRLNRQLAGQLRQLDTAKAQKASSQAQLTALRQRADALAAEQGRLNAEPAGQVSSPELDRLEQQNKALQRDIDELLGTVGG
jgi:chromosome segregation ATPase